MTTPGTTRATTVDRRGEQAIDADVLFRDYLEPHERILWSRRPGHGAVVRSRDMTLVPLGIVATLCSVGLIYAALYGQLGIEIERSLPFERVVKYALCLLALLASLFVLFGRHVVDDWQRRRTVYALTNERALILRCGRRPVFTSQPIGQFLPVTVEGTDRGSIVFGRKLQFFKEVGGNLRPVWTHSLLMGPEHPMVFEDVTGVEEAYRLIREIQTRREAEGL